MYKLYLSLLLSLNIAAVEWESLEKIVQSSLYHRAYTYEIIRTRLKLVCKQLKDFEAFIFTETASDFLIEEYIRLICDRDELEELCKQLNERMIEV